MSKTMMVKELMLGLILAVFLAGPLLGADLQTAAREAVEDERYEEARDLYIRLSEQNSWTVDYLLWVATLSDWLKDSVTATQFYDRALAVEPLNVETQLQFFQHHRIYGREHLACHHTGHGNRRCTHRRRSQPHHSPGGPSPGGICRRQSLELFEPVEHNLFFGPLPL